MKKQLSPQWRSSMSAASKPTRYAATLQSGFTMVELLVALAVSLLITLAAVSALMVTRQGFTAVDAASQLRDNGRFISDLIQRLGVQTGFKDAAYAATPPPPSVAGVVANPAPNISGFNNASLSASDPLNVSTTRTSGTLGYGSDILILGFQVAETFPGSGISDRSMIDCFGFSTATPALNRNSQVVSILHVDVSLGEPALMCTSSDTGAAPFRTSQPIIQGVENFQVLYGVDGVTAGTAPPVAPGDTVPDSYLRADQLTVAGNPAATNANWRRVRSLRVGMILRGPVNSAQNKNTQTLYPFGPAKSSSAGSIGSAMSSASDPGTSFAAPADGRLRQVVTFTVHLRNEQGL
jgi:type IV pilus assembly protein PilW